MIELTHEELRHLLASCAPAGRPGAIPIDLTAFLTSEQKAELQRHYLAVQQPRIDTQRAEVERFDNIKDALPVAAEDVT